MGLNNFGKLTVTKTKILTYKLITKDVINIMNIQDVQRNYPLLIQQSVISVQ